MVGVYVASGSGAAADAGVLIRVELRLSNDQRLGSGGRAWKPPGVPRIGRESLTMVTVFGFRPSVQGKRACFSGEWRRVEAKNVCGRYSIKGRVAMTRTMRSLMVIGCGGDGDKRITISHGCAMYCQNSLGDANALQTPR